MLSGRPPTLSAVAVMTDRSDAPSEAVRPGTLMAAITSLIALGACVWWASRQDAPRTPDSAAGYAALVAALAVYALITALRGWRWHRLLRGGEVPHGQGDAYGLTVVGYMGNTVLPARGG